MNFKRTLIIYYLVSIKQFKEKFKCMCWVFYVIIRLSVKNYSKKIENKNMFYSKLLIFVIIFDIIVMLTNLLLC